MLQCSRMGARERGVRQKAPSENCELRGSSRYRQVRSPGSKRRRCSRIAYRSVMPAM